MRGPAIKVSGLGKQFVKGDVGIAALRDFDLEIGGVPARPSSSRRSAWMGSSGTTRASCPAGCAAGSAWPGCRPAPPRRCSWTSRSTPSCAATCRWPPSTARPGLVKHRPPVLRTP
ncbi:hypothetical protein H4W80_002681 [Nonomuraea angiospora]|uniref:ABC transporter ATP-binding protein n=1 Tax=Nonomuraea angiospora TaxID=46172 RepID=A0ABR9LUU3_9ACTN|nr:hypothetical protein [Nonomuraea angiospora]